MIRMKFAQVRKFKIEKGKLILKDYWYGEG